MEEEKKKNFRIQDEDFIMEPVKEDSDCYNLVFFKRVKKKDTGEYKMEPGNPMYGLPFSACLRKIVHHKTIKKFADRNVTIKEFLKEYGIQIKEMIKLCRETLPESYF